MNNPFRATFESLSGPASPVVDHLHEGALSRLERLVEDEDGALILLRAPRAGYGKTMLISRLRVKVEDEITLIPINLTGGSGLDEESVLETFLAGITRAAPAAGGVTRLDAITRRLFALGLIPLVESGEVPSQDLEGALTSLRESPVEVFDFHDEGASVAQWARNQYQALSPKFVSVIANLSGASTSDVSSWLNVLFRFSICPPDEVGRLGELMDAVFGEMSRFRSGTGYSGAFLSFLKMVTLTEKVVLILDEVDGLFGNGESALKVASHLILIRQSAPKTKVIITVNDDVWESAFSSQLPIGIRDRLEDCQVRLDSFDESAVLDLLKSRDEEKGGQIFKELALKSSEFYPRAVLRRAREIWEKMADGSLSDQSVSAPDSPEIGFAEVNEILIPTANTPGETFQKRNPYPPKLVRRVSLPRKFLVERIREKVELTMPAIVSPFKIAVAPATVSELDPKLVPPQPPPLPNWQGQAETKPAWNPFEPKSALPASPVEASKKAKSINDLLRQFRDKRNS